MINVAVCGFGNVGKCAVELVEKSEQFNLVGVFSRRKICHPLAQKTKNIGNFVGKTDVLLLCLGSCNDLHNNLHHFHGFNTVDCFDNTDDIAHHKQLLQQKGGLSVVGAGWDPGILTIARALCKTCTGGQTTLWGEGVSQGHSNALRQIDGVIDAVQITKPVENAKSLAQQGTKALHKRICYVACVSQYQKQVEKEILQIPHYFQGENVEIVFCSPRDVRQIKAKTGHKGLVFGQNSLAECSFLLEMQNNAMLTAQIMLAYAKAIPQLKRDGYTGVLDVLDVPAKYL